MSPATPREASRRVDPLVPLLGVVAFVTYYLHGFQGTLSRDLAVYAYAGQQVVEGVPPYLGVLTRAGPLAQLIPAFGVGAARLGGFDNLLGVRVLFLVIAVACVCLVYVLARKLFASQLAGAAAATAFLSFAGFIAYASNGPREKTPMVLFLLCALLAVVSRRWFTAGLFISLATLVWQPVFFMGMAAVLVAVSCAPRSERLGALLRVAVGGLVPLTLCLVYFALYGAVGEFVEAFVVINAKYTVVAPLTSDFATHWGMLTRGFGLSLWVMLAGLGALAFLSVSALRRDNRRRDRSALAVAAVGAAGLVALAWTFRAFNDWPDAIVLLPLAAMGIGGIARMLAESLTLRVAVSVTVVWAIVTVSMALVYSVVERDHRLVYQRDAVASVLGQLPARTTILSIRAPEALVLSGKTNPTRYQMFTGGMDRYVDETYPGGLEGYGDWVGRRAPEVITLGDRDVAWWLIEPMNDYRLVGNAPGWFWFLHKSLGVETIRATRAAVRAQQLRQERMATGEQPLGHPVEDGGLNPSR